MLYNIKLTFGKVKLFQKLKINHCHMVTLSDTIKSKLLHYFTFLCLLRRKNANEYNTRTKEMALTRINDN